ncbi:hypothetical protein KFU94_06350 [Chloroflexi bacterium TSY]|nr:hypothetical protein [Chloroflexi bacterium TSY]
MAVSLINVILLGWLALTVLLNAERRHWLVWMVGGGLLVGCAFFVSHTAILALSMESFGFWLNLWWRLGWLPLTALPIAWYGMILWYIDFWGSDQVESQFSPAFRQRQRWGLSITVILFVILVGLLIFTRPLPSFSQTAQLQFGSAFGIAGFPVLLLVFPIYILLSTGLPLDALYHPAPSERLMGDQARRRARPWLIAATGILLLVSLAVSGISVWLLLVVQPYDVVREMTPFASRAENQLGRSAPLSQYIVAIDLLLSSLIALAVMMVGQAIISYEIFTGQSLPRGELRRSWWNAIMLALGFGVLVGLSFALRMQPISALLLATILMTSFYALLSWRSFARREEYIRQLRPFLGSQHLYEQLLTLPESTSNSALKSNVESDTQGLPSAKLDVSMLFQTLCNDILRVNQAQLTGLGSLASFVGQTLAYPDQQNHIDPPLSAQQLTRMQSPSSQSETIPLDPTQYLGYIWAVPLWSERGLIGVFLLGSKRDNGLYTQEEIEIARASGERLIDTLASAEIAQRLLTLQRQQLVESQLLDRRTRRVLHDEILPQLHAALLSLPSAEESVRETTELLTTTHRQISDLLRATPPRPTPSVLELGLLNALRQLVREELATAFDDVVWQVAHNIERTVQKLSPLTIEVLFYATREVMRNAARYRRGGQPERPLCLHITIRGGQGLAIQVRDDGVGANTVRTVQHDGGHGLALHSTLLAIVGGEMNIQSEENVYTQVILKVPEVA